jgi:hypothetical protein
MELVHIFEAKIAAALEKSDTDTVNVLVNSYSEYVRLHVNAISNGVPINGVPPKEAK